MSGEKEEGQRFEITEEDIEHHRSAAAGELSKIPVLKRVQQGKKVPTCVIVVGMAGSGKTTLMAQLQRSLDAVDGESSTAEQQDRNYDVVASETSTEDSGSKTLVELPGDAPTDDLKSVTPARGYCLNLDPATLLVPFGASIDIRDTVDYKEVMKQHHLGPNGAIMTSLNLFCTKFDQVLGILEQRADDNNGSLDYILVDTPGQIEAFTWSASGTIMSEGLASSFPTVLAFVVDCVRCAASPNTFMSNMLYACSMLYRTRLPLVVVFNKIDVVSHNILVEWMQDYDAFQDALDEMQANSDGSSSSGFYGSLTRSLSLVLDEFYRQLHSCGVSAATGDGIDDFWRTIDVAAKEFQTEYVQDLQNRIEEQQAKKRAIARDGVRRLRKDVVDASAKQSK